MLRREKIKEKIVLCIMHLWARNSWQPRLESVHICLIAWILSHSLKPCVFEDEGLASYGFELDDDAGVGACGGFHDGAFAELGVADD